MPSDTLLYTKTKKLRLFSMAMYLSTQLRCRHKNKTNFFPNARHTKSGNPLNLSSIPKELSTLMLKQHF